jgi:Na+/H+ antiporter NhaD/arsenite permease-like protein
MDHRASRSRWLVASSVLLVGLVVAIAIAAALASTLLPTGDQMGGEGRNIAAGVVFVGSYLALAIGRIPGLSIDRAGIALVGAGLTVASGALPLEDAYKAVDLDTITLLLGMMIVVANLRLSGFFAVVNAWVMAHARRPLVLLGALVATSGVLSAFLVNDAICLVLAPLVLELTLALKRWPVPYLLAVAMASNVGSTATITGNPQNIMIGSFSHIPYTRFALALGPVALVGLIVTVALIALFHRAEFAGAARLEAPPPKVDANRVLVVRALLATLILIALFFAGVVPAKAAIILGGLLRRDRLVAAADVRRPVHHRRRRSARASQPRHHRCRGPVPSRPGSCPQRGDGGAVQPRQQRAGRADAQAVRGCAGRPRHGMAGDRDGLDARRQLHRVGLDRQPDRGAEGGRFRCDDRLLGLFQGGRATDHHHPRARDAVAMAVISTESKAFNPLSLDAVNFLLSDVRGAMGPFLNVFLVTQQYWSLSQVGLATTISGLLGLAVQTPIGAAIDETRAKRGAIVLALAVLGIGAIVIFVWPSFWPVLIANSLVAIVGDVFGPAVAALTLGLYARDQLARRMGRNSAFDHAGNVAIAVVAAGVGYVFSQRAVFLLVPVFAVLAAIAVFPFRLARSTTIGQETSTASTMRRQPRPERPATASCSRPARWSSSASASCCFTLPMRRCCRWWDRSSPPHFRTRQRP